MADLESEILYEKLAMQQKSSLAPLGITDNDNVPRDPFSGEVAEPMANILFCSRERIGHLRAKSISYNDTSNDKAQDGDEGSLNRVGLTSLDALDL